MDYLLDQGLKLEVMVYLACFLLEFVFPKDGDVNPESSPPYSRQLDNLIICNWIGNNGWPKSWMQFDVNPFYILAQSLITWSRLHEKCPSILVIFLSFNQFRCIANQKSSKFSLLYQLLLFVDAVRVSNLKFIPQLLLSYDLIRSKSCSTERASFILDDQSSLRQAILAENVLAFDQTKRLIEYAETDRALMVLEDFLMSLDLLIFH